MVDYDELTDEEIAALIKECEDHEKFHQDEYLLPYQYQKKFMDKGKFYRRRLFRAGNRVGKSFVAALELSYHITGRYPEWWNGDRFPEGGHSFWVIGVDLDQARRVQQLILLGTEDAKGDAEGLGTGMIPLDAIESIDKDGMRIKSAVIRHTSGMTNTIQFFGSAQGQETLMGSAIKYVWIDEDFGEKSIDFFSQCAMRTATTRGHIVITATPEKGYTKLMRMFDEDDTDTLYLLSAGWDDCPHWTEEMIRQELATVPEREWEMRRYGKPILGTGAVFPFKPSEITFEPHELNLDDPSIVINGGMDLGKSSDPSTIVYMALDKNTGIHYAISEVGLDDDIFTRSGKNIAHTILNGPFPNVEMIAPHDSALKQSHELAIAKQIRDAGFGNLHKNMNPLFLRGQKGNNAENAVMPGLDQMRMMMQEGKLKISTECKQLLREINGYAIIIKNGKEEPKGATGDHFIDAFRLATMGMLRNIYSPVYTARIIGANRFNSYSGEDYGNRETDPTLKPSNYVSNDTGYEMTTFY